MADFFDRILEKRQDTPLIEGTLKKYGKPELKRYLQRAINGEDASTILPKGYTQEQIDGFNSLTRQTNKLADDLGFSPEVGEFFKGIGRSDYSGEGYSKIVALETADALRSSFKRQIGRDATDDEVSSLIRDVDFSAPFVQGDGSRNYKIPYTHDSYIDALKLRGNFNSVIQAKRPILDEIDKGRLDLKKYGEELPADFVKNILGSATTPESAQEKIAAYAKTRGEAKIQEQLSGLPAQEEKAIGELETTLQEQQGRYFSEQLAPRITESLNQRGLLNSGSFASSLTRAGQQSYQGVSDVIRPLRSQVKMGAPQRGFEQTLRGALEQGKSLAEATAFARNLLTQGRSQAFAAASSELDRIAGLQATQLGLAARGGQRQPTSMEYFLQYGLPVIGDITSSIITAKKKK